MTEAVSAVLANADYFVFMLFRVGALVVSSPIFGRVSIPLQAKIGFIVALSYLFFRVIHPVDVIEYTTLVGFFLVVVSEVLIGMALAFITNLFFAVTFIGGHLIDMQIGFGIVNVYDVQNNTQVPLIGNLLNIILLVIFFMMDGHLRLIHIIYLTIDKMPVGNLLFSPGAGLAALEIFANAFMIGVMVALPVTASGITLEICFGALIRTVPQMNMFVVGVPAKLIVGLIVLLVTIPVFINYGSKIFDELFLALDKMFGALAAVT